MKQCIVKLVGLMVFLAVVVAIWVPKNAEANIVMPAGSTCRSSTIKHQFDKLNGYPKGRRGYVVDHICALEEGGLDSVVNMQYQDIVEGHKKDRIERTPFGKAQFCTPENSTPTRKVFNCKGSKEK